MGPKNYWESRDLKVKYELGLASWTIVTFPFLTWVSSSSSSRSWANSLRRSNPTARDLGAVERQGSKVGQRLQAFQSSVRDCGVSKIQMLELNKPSRCFSPASVIFA